MGSEEDKGKMVPLRMLYPSVVNRQLPVLSCASRFCLPHGWTAKLVLRSDGSHVDKYYYEPSTKKVFRSGSEVERYLNGEEYTPRCKSLGYHQKSTIGNFGPEKMIMPGEKLPRINKKELDQSVVNSATIADTLPFVLPDGWAVKKVPRKNQGSDKVMSALYSFVFLQEYKWQIISNVCNYYYEPGTGRKFRSLVEVERHLQEEKREKAPLSHMFEIGNYGKKRKDIGTSSSDFVEPPDKIIWILKDSDGLAWNPLMGKTFVPHPIKNQWALKFIQMMINNNVVAPDFKKWKS